MFLFNTVSVSGQLVADFTATPLSGCAPLVVQFTDNSTGAPSNWNWDFGNGSTAAQKNPVITYTTPGVYTVILTVSNTSGSNSITKNQYIRVYDYPQVNFTVNDSFNCIPFTTRFTDLSTSVVSNITSWQWNFDDGNTSTLQNPTHLYSQAGNFNITLRVTTSGGCTKSLSKLAYIKAADSIRTQFNFSLPTKCKPPESISFYNNTSGPGLINYTWDFGDGSTLTTFSPSHVYTEGGLYTIKLIARNNIGCTDTLILKDTLFIKNVRSAITSADTVCANYRMLLNNSTIPTPLSSQWVYSDGTTSFSSTTAKTWANPGTYVAKLVSNFNACSDTISKNISVLPTPVINFSASDVSACRVPFTTTFTDMTSNAANWLWNFGDGTTSAIRNPTHTFTREGAFEIKLAVSSASGCSATQIQPAFIRVHKPYISIDTKEGGGCIPYTFTPASNINAPDGIAGYLWDFGNGNTSTAPQPTEVYTTAGTFNIKLRLTSIDGCIDSLVIPAGVRTAGFKPAIDFSATPTVVCPGTPVQFTNLSTLSDKWLWKFGDGTSDVENPVHAFHDSGTYSIKLIAWNNGCNDSIIKSRIITVQPGYARFKPVFTCTNKREVFFKDSSVLPQTWRWNFGDGNTSTEQNPLHIFSDFQSYTVSLTTTNSACTSTTSLQVKTINEIPDFRLSKTAVCKSDPVAFYLQGFNNNHVKKITWDFGDGVTDSLSGDSVWHTYRQAGSFTVKLTITDTNNCRETTTKPNLIYVSSPKASFTASVMDGCRNKPINFTNTSINESGNNNIVRCIWDFGDGESQSFSTTITNPVPHNYMVTGYYYPSLKIIDSIGCADSISFLNPVHIFQPVANFFAPNFNTCMADTLMLRNPSTGSRITYLWNFGDGTISTDSLPVKIYTANGDYTVGLVVTDMAGCKDSMIKVNYVKVREVIAAFKVNDSTGTCIPFNVKFTNTSLNALSHLWNFGDGAYSSASSPVYTYTNRGEYIVKLTSRRSSHCIKSDSIRIKVNGPSARLQYRDTSGCSPLEVAFSVITSDPLTYAWDFNDGVVVSNGDSATVHSYMNPGKFVPSVVIKDSSGCIVQLTGTDTIQLYSSKVDYRAADSAVCAGDSIYFYNATIAGSSITGYKWLFGDGDSTDVKDPVHFYQNTGTYPVKLIVTTSYGCTDSLLKPNYIKINTIPQINIAGHNASYCGQSSITFNGNITTTDTVTTYWNWDFGNGQTSTYQYPPPQVYIDTGIYKIRVQMQYASGCADTANASIQVYPVPNTFSGNDTMVCEGRSIPLYATGANNYSWQPSNNLNCSDCANPVSTTVDNMLYTATGTNIFGCSKTDSVFITVKKPVTVVIANNSRTICAGENIQLSVSGAEIYSWSPIAGLNDIHSASPIANPAITTTYIVTGTDSLNCFYDTASAHIQVYAAPKINAGPDIILSNYRQVTITPQYSNDIVKWLWQPAVGLSCTNCPSPVAFPSDGITYRVEVTNEKGCKSADDIFIQLKCDRGNIYMPTAFSPQGNQSNKKFCPLTLPGTGSLKVTSFKIYNRLGQLVFQNGNFNANDHAAGWDGKYNGADAPAGAYVYTVEFICNSNKVVTFNGNIFLLR